MPSEPFPLDPVRVEPRGEFPRHSDEPRPILTAALARQQARQRLLDWWATHGH